MNRFLLLLTLGSAPLLAQTAETIPFRAVLLPSNEIPAVDTTASGAATILIHVVRDNAGNIVSGSVDFDTSYTFPGAVNITGMHIHSGAAGVNGPVVISSGLSGSSPVVDATGKGVIDRQAQVTETSTAGLDAIRGILANPANYYVNMHTDTNPGGIMRGQLEAAEMKVLGGIMSPANEVPAIDGSTVSGFGTVVALITRDSIGNLTSAQVLFQIDYKGFPDGTLFSGMHVHLGAAGANGPVTLDSGIKGGDSAVPVAAGGTGTLRATAEINIFRTGADASLYALLNDPSRVYLNVHTTVNPGGIMRTQLHEMEHLSFPVSLQTANEVPAVTSITAQGLARFEAYALRDSTGAVIAGAGIFDVNCRFPSDTTVTGMHIHAAAAGTNGPVKIDSGLSGTSPAVGANGFGNLFRIVSINSAPALEALNGLLANPENYYMNAHTPANPGGVFRSQLAAANTNLPQIAGVISAVSSGTLTTIAQGGLMTIFGYDLAKTPTDLSGVVGTQMPTAANGTSVTVGGMAAPIISIGYVPGFNPPAYIVVQAPFETPVGSQPVVVTSSNGPSSAANITVAAVAPGIFFDAKGGIAFKMDDFSLIRPNNPAAAGSAIGLVTVGLGQTNPALTTGQVAAVSPQAVPVSTVTATVGGQAATVQSYSALGGYTGIYLVAVQLPSGATGTVEVAIASGGTASNTVTIPVQ